MKRMVLLSVMCLMLSLMARADGYWLELSGTHHLNDTLTIRIRYGGVHEDKTRYVNSGKALDKMKDFRLYVTMPSGLRKRIAIKQENDCWVGYVVPATDGVFQVFAVDDRLPVVERADSMENIKPIQYLYADYQVGNSAKTGRKPTAYLYLKAAVQKKVVSIVPYIKGKKVAPGTELRVFYPDNEDRKLVVSDRGVATLPLTESGSYMIRLDNICKEYGNVGNKRYFAIRHRCDYSLVVQ
ncbi:MULTISPECIES: hypothetical protein [Chitinophagaceae]